jgi:hypothetical protein
MIVALLILIVLILLFGAGVVNGWTANVATAGCGFIAICLPLAWLGSFFGKDGFMYVFSPFAASSCRKPNLRWQASACAVGNVPSSALLAGR